MPTVNTVESELQALPNLVQKPDPLEQIQKGLLQLQEAASTPDSLLKKLAPLITGVVFLLGGIGAWYNQTQENDRAIAVLEERIGESDHVGNLGSKLEEFMRYQHLHNERLDTSMAALGRRLDIIMIDHDSQEEREYRRLQRKFRRENQ